LEVEAIDRGRKAGIDMDGQDAQDEKPQEVRRLGCLEVRRLGQRL
jgi:hypothetical protein